MNVPSRVTLAHRSLAAALLLTIGPAAFGGIPHSVDPAQDSPFGDTSTSDFGGVGLWQVPSARFAGDGRSAFGGSTVWPHNRFFLTFQPMPWLEATLRYTETTNRLYGPVEFSGHQTLKDRGFDLKVRLSEESRRLPQFALGIRDLGGTRLFGSEYLVASKRYYDWDFSLGIAWGNLGSRGLIANPLARLSDRFATRGGQASEGGQIGRDLFAGDRASIIGGIEWHAPVRGLRFKVELDGNDYRSEPGGNNQAVSSPFNFGVVYSPRRLVELSLGLERGNEVVAQLVLRTDLSKDAGQPKLDRPPVPIRGRGTSRPANRATSDMGRSTPGAAAVNPPADKFGDPDVGARLIRGLGNEGFGVVAVDVSDHDATAWISQSRFREVARAVGRTARIMANEAPPEVEILTVANLEAGLETGRVSLIRSDLERAATFDGSPEEVWEDARTSVTAGRIPTSATVNARRYPTWGINYQPALRQHVGGPDDFYFWQLWLRLGGYFQATRELSFDFALGANIKNNFADLKLESNSLLPHVRSDIKDYLKQGKNNLVQLEAHYIWKPSAKWYARVSAGIFEEMYGGVSGELLYRPYTSRWAIGLDLAEVRKRGFEQRFAFLDYRILTGHATFYYETPIHVLAKISIGQYLAGDRGVTVDVCRTFPSGVRIGAFVTRTNVSARQFGEGSYDKGLYLSVPLDRSVLRSSRSSTVIAWRPLTRDGGQMLNMDKRLYGYTVAASPGALQEGWYRLMD